MSLSHKFLARSVVFFLLLGLIPAVQLPAISAQDTATYNLTKYDCTPGYDPGTADENSAFANCATPASGVSFTLTSGDDSYAGGTQQTDGGGSTSWSGIPLGSGYSISESIPPGYGVPWVYCEVSGDPNNPSDVQQSFFQAPGGTMDVGYTNPSLTSYTQASCSWFNVPPANGTADLQTEGGENQPPGTTTVTIHKQVCGYRYDAQGKTLAQLQADCPGTTTGVGFTIGGESSTLQFTDQNGEVVLNGVALGSVRIQEELFAGVDAVRVFCQAHPTGDTSVSYSDTDELPLEDGSNDTWAVTVQATEGNKIDCLWFNSILTESDYSTVIVHKYECPNGYDPDSEALDDLIANCTAPIANPSFDLINVNVQLTVAGDATGTVAALNIQPGSYSLHQTLPEGYLAVRVLCHPDEVGAQQAELAAYIEYSFTDPNQVDIDVEAGYELTCYWFDVPTSNPPDAGTVTVYKYNCPDVFDWENGEIDYLRSGCTEPGSGIDFQLRTASYQSPQNTDNSGLAAWSDAPEGTLTLFEDVPDGYKVGRFFCGVSSDSGTEPSSWDEYTYDGGVDVERPFGQYLSCYIFDVPSGFGTVYVYKYECAPDFDWQNGTYDYLASGCTTAQEDVTFEVSAQTPGNYSEEQTTDSSGVASWTDVPEGGVSILEQEPEGYALGRVFCGVTEQNSASLPSSWDEYDHTPEVDAEVPAGQYLHCTFFDITGNYGSIVITKYLCHGGSAELGSEADYDTYTSQCTEPGDGYDFTVSTSAGDLPGQTGVDGTVSWSALEPGDVTVSESLPSGYDSFAVYCTTDPSSGDYQQYVGEQVYSFDYTAEEGVTLYCSWFDYAPDTGTTITIYKYTCEHFFVRGWPTRVDYEEHCTAPQSGVDFTLYAGMAVVDTATSDAAGVATLDVSQSGQYQIVESPIEGYLTAAVFCTTSSTDDPAQAETLPVTIDVTVDYPVTCFWYNGEDLFGGTTSDPGTVVIHKYECPPGYPESGTNGFEDILGACTLPANNVAFSVSQGGSEVTSGSTGDAGEVALTGAATGATRVSEFPIEGWDPPRVFCAIVPVGIGRVLASYDEQTVTTWGIDFDFPADSYIDCYWFDRPPSNGTEGQPIQIIIHKILCAPDTLPGDAFEGAITECDQKEEGVDFALVGGDGGSVSGPTDVNGYAEYNGLAPGNVTITETLRDGYKTGAVFCSAYTSTQGDYELFPVTDESISYYLAGGYKLECYWFNIQEPPTGTVYIFKYRCDQEPGYSTRDEYHAACTEKQDGVTFSLQHSSESYSATGETSGGNILWYDVPSGAVEISETPPSGYQPYAVFCGYSDVAYIPPATWDSPAIVSGAWSIESEVLADQFLMCEWYDYAYETPPQVWIYKVNCDQTADWHWDYDQLVSGCTEPAPGVEFGFGEEGSGPSLSITDDEGKWHYDPLTPGAWFFEESLPDGYSGAVVYCQWVTPYGTGDYQKGELDGSRLWLELDYGDVVTCYWFDFPTGYEPPTPTPPSGGSGDSGGSGGSSGSGGAGGTGGPPPLTSNVPKGPTGGGTSGGGTSQQGNSNAPATLIIVKHTCPKGYDLYAEDADASNDCQDLTSDIDFALTSLTPDVENGTPTPNEPVTQTTADDGKATWSNLAAGPYLVVETMPEDVHAAFIWTCASDQREFQLEYPFTPFSYTGPAGQIGITLIGGETLECAWYDVPAAPGTVTIHLLDCPSSPVIPSQCQPAGAGVQLSLGPSSGEGPTIDMTTDENGVATGEGEGTFALLPYDGTPCLIDSEAIDDQGAIVIGEGQSVEVEIYSCGGDS